MKTTLTIYNMLQHNATQGIIYSYLFNQFLALRDIAKLHENFRLIQQVTPGKINMEWKWTLGRLFSSTTTPLFSGSMLIFQGVAE